MATWDALGFRPGFRCSLSVAFATEVTREPSLIFFDFFRLSMVSPLPFI
jgi:hypothetical protein